MRIKVYSTINLKLTERKFKSFDEDKEEHNKQDIDLEMLREIVRKVKGERRIK